MKNNLTDYHRLVLHGDICPKCKTTTKLIPASQLFNETVGSDFVIVCRNFPNCNNYTYSIPGTRNPEGRLVNPNGMLARSKAKKKLNELVNIKQKMTREEAYKELSEHLFVPLEFCDPVYLNTKNCKRVETWCIKKLYHFQYLETGEFVVPMTSRNGKRKRITIIESTGPHTCIVEFDEDEKRMEINSDKIFFHKPKK